jgi:hypothetical protein
MSLKLFVFKNFFDTFPETMSKLTLSVNHFGGLTNQRSRSSTPSATGKDVRYEDDSHRKRITS